MFVYVTLWKKLSSPAFGYEGSIKAEKHFCGMNVSQQRW